MVYLMETNANVYSWLVNFYKENPIPKVCGPNSKRMQGNRACRLGRAIAAAAASEHAGHRSDSGKAIGAASATAVCS
jgi:hypothetical protein